MIESLYIAETGMVSQQKLIDVISNNIANSSTPGFKKSQLNFSDMVSNHKGASSLDKKIDSSIFNGAGVMAAGVSVDFSVGELKLSGNPYELAIQGNGFFELRMEDGTSAYTRDGRFQVDNDGYLSSTKGMRLVGDILIPPDTKELIISADGVVAVKTSTADEIVEVGRIELSHFSNTAGLKDVGGNIYTAQSDRIGNHFYATPGELGTGTIQQGMMEYSNVSMTQEMVALMLAQRGYQLNARLVQISDQIMDTINNLRR